MTTPYGIGLIGLGSIGQRMLRNAAIHDRVVPRVAWDLDPARMNSALSGFPRIEGAGSAADLIRHPAVDIVYVASPPLTHAEHARAALEAAKPVLCEKPLGVDVDASRKLVEHAGRAGVANAVNFIYASGAGSELEGAIDANALGRVLCVDLHIHARQWAEHRYGEAPWLADGDQGGVVREVISHYVYLSQRLFGPARVHYAHVGRSGRSGGAETHAIAHLECAGVPIHIVANTEGAAPDQFEYTIRGERESRSTFGLYQLRTSDGGPWQPSGPIVSDPAASWFRQQLDNIADWAGCRPHTMPDFAAALSVQEVIEEMLRS